MHKTNSNDDKKNENFVEYEEVFVGQEIEVDEDEEIEFVYMNDQRPPFAPPPPPMRGGFPPPYPPYFMPPHLQVIDDDEDDAEDEDDYEYEQEDDFAQLQPKSKPKTFSDLTPPELKAIESQGQEQSLILKSAHRFDVFKKVLYYTSVFVGTVTLLIVSTYLVLYQFAKVKEDQEVSISKTVAEQKGRFDLGNNALNTLLEKFYSTIGDIAILPHYKDMLIRGTITLKGRGAEEFYCIKRSDGRNYLKIGDNNNVRAFLIDSSEGVYALPDLRTKGRKEALSGTDALTIRAVVTFDEFLYTRLFDKYRSDVLSADIKYIGMNLEDDNPTESLSITNENLEVRYNFNQNDSFLNNLAIRQGDDISKTYFSDFRNTNADLTYPYKIQTKINGDTIAELEISSIMINRGSMFP